MKSSLPFSGRGGVSLYPKQQLLSCKQEKKAFQATFSPWPQSMEAEAGDSSLAMYCMLIESRGIIKMDWLLQPIRKV